MRNINKGWFVLAVVVFVIGLIYGCGQTTSTTSTTTSGGTFFYTNTSNTTPVFKPSTISTQNLQTLSATEWGAGNPLYNVYFSLREFLSPRDEGVVDRSNLYKMLIDVDTVFSGTSLDAVAITEQEITPPFSKLQKITCNKATNEAENKRAIALKDITNEVDAIITWIWADSAAANEYGLASVTFNKNTKDITVDMTYSVDYDLSGTQTDYNLRCNVSGNAENNTFQFKYIIGDAKIVAKGVSKGAGNYMLFKYTGFGASVKYIVVPGDADENFFKSQNTNPTLIYSNPSDLPASVEAYRDWVTSEAFFTSAEVVSDISILNSGNSKQGTIYLNYQ